jgi:hypothetical protein
MMQPYWVKLCIALCNHATLRGSCSHDRPYPVPKWLLCLQSHTSFSRPRNALRCCRPHVNFISGSNGSGKSASLQALQCCLGVKARDTGRATKAEQFIKTGCSHAVAAVSLWNTGGDALNPGQYGSSITIERRITKSSSTFSIKDAGGRKVRYKTCHLLMWLHDL